MCKNGLAVERTRKFKAITDGYLTFNIAPTLPDRGFTTDRPNLKRAGDISHIWTRDGWLYLDGILGLHSRRMNGWVVSNRVKRGSAIRALRMAIALRAPPPPRPWNGGCCCRPGISSVFAVQQRRRPGHLGAVAARARPGRNQPGPASRPKPGRRSQEYRRTAAASGQRSRSSGRTSDARPPAPWPGRRSCPSCPFSLLNHSGSTKNRIRRGQFPFIATKIAERI